MDCHPRPHQKDRLRNQERVGDRVISLVLLLNPLGLVGVVLRLHRPISSSSFSLERSLCWLLVVCVNIVLDFCKCAHRVLGEETRASFPPQTLVPPPSRRIDPICGERPSWCAGVLPTPMSRMIVGISPFPEIFSHGGDKAMNAIGRRTQREE